MQAAALRRVPNVVLSTASSKVFYSDEADGRNIRPGTPAKGRAGLGRKARFRLAPMSACAFSPNEGK